MAEEKKTKPTGQQEEKKEMTQSKKKKSQLTGVFSENQSRKCELGLKPNYSSHQRPNCSKPNPNWAPEIFKAHFEYAPATSKDRTIVEPATCTCQAVFVFTDTFPQ
jgi:hypothetical protein